MRWRTDTTVACAAIGLSLTACGAEISDEPVATSTLALDVCEESVPANRYVDGLPAYAQCDEVESAAVWSSNGVDTSTTAQGSEWIRTQHSGGYQCTEWAYRYMYFRFGVDYRHGNAREWCDGDLPPTLVKSSLPVHGDLIVFDGGSCGADGETGHIAVIDTVDASAAKVTFVEQNRAGRRTADQSCALCFLHAVANDGTSPAGGGGAGGAAGAAGTSAGGVAGSAATDAGGVAGAAGANLAVGGAASAGRPSTNGGTPGSSGGAQGGMATGGTSDSAGSSQRPAQGGVGGNSGGAGTSGTTSRAGSASAGDGGSPRTPNDAHSIADESGCQIGGTPYARTSGSIAFWLLMLAARLRRRDRRVLFLYR
jgi:hypothetical protein